ncbi:MAG: hypothetical protein Q9169_005573 [Polycauliona sp. 2 TL-2023]
MAETGGVAADGKRPNTADLTDGQELSSSTTRHFGPKSTTIRLQPRHLGELSLGVTYFIYQDAAPTRIGACTLPILHGRVQMSCMNSALDMVECPRYRKQTRRIKALA